MIRLQESKMHRPNGGIKNPSTEGGVLGGTGPLPFSVHDALVLNSCYEGPLTYHLWKKLQVWTWNKKRKDYDKGDLISLPGDGEEVKVADLLVMRQSKYDNLMQTEPPYASRPAHELIEMNSCPTENGGFFVLNGLRWCIVPQEMKSSFRVHRRIGQNGFEFVEFEGQTRDSNYRNDKVSIRGDRTATTNEKARGRVRYSRGGAKNAANKKKKNKKSNANELIARDEEKKRQEEEGKIMAYHNGVVPPPALSFCY